MEFVLTGSNDEGEECAPNELHPLTPFPGLGIELSLLSVMFCMLSPQESMLYN